MTISAETAIRRAFETRLAAMATNIAIAYEAFDFTPVDGVPYQYCAILRAADEKPEMSRKMTILRGIFQVTLMYPLGDGAADAETQAGVVKEWFKPVLTMNQDGFKVQVIDAISVSSGFRSESRWAIPISIPYVVQVNG
jgi:hypothetical protein